MPIYEYICRECGYKFEQLVASMRNRTLPLCPKCQGRAKRQVSSVFAAHSRGNSPACGGRADSCGLAGDSACQSGNCPFSR